MGELTTFKCLSLCFSPVRTDDMGYTFLVLMFYARKIFKNEKQEEIKSASKSEITLLNVLSFMILFLFVVGTRSRPCPYIVFAFNPLFGEEGNVPKRHEGSSQLHKCLVIDLAFDFDLAFDLAFAVGEGPPVGRDMKKVVFCILSGNSLKNY